MTRACASDVNNVSIQQLIPQPAVEALDEGVLHGFVPQAFGGIGFGGGPGFIKKFDHSAFARSYFTRSITAGTGSPGFALILTCQASLPGILLFGN